MKLYKEVELINQLEENNTITTKEIKNIITKERFSPFQLEGLNPCSTKFPNVRTGVRV